MALFHGVINSKALMKDTTLSMIVPSDDRKNIGFQGQPQLLILLHGAGGAIIHGQSIHRLSDILSR